MWLKKCFKKGDKNMKLIVGLGNPGKEYENTRHNIGFMVLDRIADSYNESFNKENFFGKYFMSNIKGEKVIFLKPQKYMNLSGEVIRPFIDFFKINLDDILIICDDLDTEVGNIRLRYKGSSGGHNGLKDIEKHLGTQNYKRIKIGISNNKMIDTKDYVLGKFSKEEMNIIEKTIDKALENLSYSEINLYYNHYYSYSKFGFLKLQLFPVKSDGKYFEGDDYVYETDAVKMIRGLLSFYICYQLKMAESISVASENVLRNQITSMALDRIDEQELIKINKIRKYRLQKTVRKNVDNYKRLMEDYNG